MTTGYAHWRMELRHLRYFIAVAEEENVSRAALKLHVSQPALSRQVRDLEDELGFLLFERSAKSMSLTEAGRAFLGEARAVIRRVEEAVSKTRLVATGARTEIHVGYAPSLTVQILPQTLHAFQVALPSVRVALHDLSSEEMLTQLREGQLQVAFLVRPAKPLPRGLRFEELARYRMCVAMTPAHRLARQHTVTLEQAAQHPLVGYSRKEHPEYHADLEAMFAAIHSKPRVAEEHDGVTSLVAAVEAGRGVALVPESLGCFAGPRLKLTPLSPAPEPLVVGVAWTEGGQRSTAERFARCAREVALKQA
jgi:LysR family transcriptional regulator, benzoate and cis,cis-muconate-responsive activator of ben and cat genes